MVLILCATINIVESFVSLKSAFLKLASVLKSSAENESSNIYISGLVVIARAIESLCF